MTPYRWRDIAGKKQLKEQPKKRLNARKINGICCFFRIFVFYTATPMKHVFFSMALLMGTLLMAGTEPCGKCGKENCTESAQEAPKKAKSETAQAGTAATCAPKGEAAKGCASEASAKGCCSKPAEKAAAPEKKEGESKK
jgi:hypothetical protein